MKLISLLDQLAATPTTAATPRRALLQQAGRVAVAALPLGLGAALPATASIQDTSYDAVTQLLLLERLQLAYYTRALGVAGLIPAAQVADFQRLQRHQSQHAAFLTQALQNAGAVVPAVPTFDFSGRRNGASNPELFPNVKLAYLSSRTYGGYATIGLNPEPYAFESAFSVKWLVEQQIKGDKALDFDPAHGEVKAPWLAWGPYLWANGSTPREDGFSYEPADFTSSDGTHQSLSGQRKVGQLLLKFFESDSTTKSWFVKP